MYILGRGRASGRSHRCRLVQPALRLGAGRGQRQLLRSPHPGQTQQFCSCRKMKSWCTGPGCRVPAAGTGSPGQGAGTPSVNANEQILKEGSRMARHAEVVMAKWHGTHPFRLRPHNGRLNVFRQQFSPLHMFI